MYLTDSHAHLDFMENLQNALENAKSSGVAKVITIGTSVKCAKECLDIAENYSSHDLGIFATAGIHAEDGKSDLDKYKDPIGRLKKLALLSKKIVAIGECGFDFRDSTTNKEKEFQQELFEKQIELAIELNLPLVIHCRNAWKETFDLIQNTKYPILKTSLRGVFHSFTGSVAEMEKAISLGFYVSFSGIVTFKNAAEIARAAKEVPLEKLLIETDSPFLTPEPMRGKKNEPKNVRITAQFLAQLRNQSLDSLIEATSRNAEKLFGI